MATIHGNAGTVEIAANAVAHVTAFSLTRSVNYPSNTAMGAAAETYQTGGPEASSGELTCRYDKTDTNGQEVLQPNTALAAVLYPEGNASGRPELSASILVQEITHTQNMADVVEKTFRFLVNGAVTEGVVTP